jgi:hypothetical protein
MPIRESESERTKIYTCNYKWKIFHDHYLNIYEIALFFAISFKYSITNSESSFSEQKNSKMFF